MTATVVDTPTRGGAVLSRPSGWWGMVLVVATEATLFLLLVASYFYLRVARSGTWPPAPLTDPAITKPALVTVAIVLSSVPIVVATGAARHNKTAIVRLALMIALVLSAVFLAGQWLLVRHQLHTFHPQDGAYASIYYTLIGVHYAHVAVAVLLALYALVRSAGYTPERHLSLRLTAMYWHFVNVVAIVVFVVLYLSPRA